MDKHKASICLPCPASTILTQNFDEGSQSQKVFMIVYLHANLLFPYYFFMNCIIDQCYVCHSPINFTTCTFLYVVSLLTIRLAYDLFTHLFSFSFHGNTKVKRAKT